MADTISDPFEGQVTHDGMSDVKTSGPYSHAGYEQQHQFNPSAPSGEGDNSANTSAGGASTTNTSANAYTGGHSPGSSSLSSLAAIKLSAPLINGRWEVVVTDPEKKGEGINQYMSYRINTQIDENGQIRQSSVVRRFSDFVWLHNQLTNAFPGVIIPPIPDKAIIGRFSIDFLNERRRGLEHFLNRVAAHPDLSAYPIVHLFLIEDDTTLAAAKEGQRMEEKKSSKGFMTYFRESIQSISNSFGSGKERDRTPDDIACEKINEYATQLETHLNAVHTAIDSLLKKNKGLAKSWFEFGLSCTLMSKYESDQMEATLANALACLGTSADHLSVILNTKVEAENAHFREPLKEYIRLADSVKAMIRTRNSVLLSYQTAVSQLESKKAKLESVKGQPGKEDKALALEKSVMEAQTEADNRKAEVERVTEKALSEFERFKQIKEQELKRIIIHYVKMQIEHSKKIEAAWSSILPELEH